VVTDSGYGSEQNYEVLKHLSNLVIFTKNKRGAFKTTPSAYKTCFTTKKKTFMSVRWGNVWRNWLIPNAPVAMVMNQLLVFIRQKTAEVVHPRLSTRGCPLRGMCHQAKTNRRMEVNHRLNELKDKARVLLLSPQGIEMRSKRPVEVEAVFGQLKSNNKFNRFTLRGLQKVNVEFGLMAIGHNFRKWSGQITKKLKNDSVLKSFVNNLSLLKHLESFKFDSEKPRI
jgi:hypothetical protein